MTDERSKATDYKEFTETMARDHGLEFTDALLSFVFKATPSEYADSEEMTDADRTAVERAVVMYANRLETAKEVADLTDEDLLARYAGSAIMSQEMIVCSEEIHRRATAMTDGKTFEVVTDAINVLRNSAATTTRAMQVRAICQSYIDRYENAQDVFMSYSNENSFVAAIESRGETMIAYSVSAAEASTILTELRKDEKNCIENLLSYIEAERKYFTRRDVRISNSTNAYRNVVGNTRLEAKARTLFENGELYGELEQALASVA